MSEIDFFRFLVGLAILFYATYTDVKTRLVSNILWLLMVSIGLAILEINLFFLSAPIQFYLTPIVAIIFFLTIFSEGELFIDYVSKKKNNILVFSLNFFAILLLLYQYTIAGFSEIFISLLLMYFMLFLSYFFYRTGLLQGGADAKALMSLSILVPFYPHILSYPIIQLPEIMELTFPFALVILFNSVIILIFLPIFFIIYNISKMDIGLPMFYGYKVDIDSVKKRFIWLAEKIVDGKRIYVFFPSKEDTDEELEKLKKIGIKKVWVTPQIPFMLPMFIGFIVSFFIGNIMIWLIGLVI
ncbi:MAG: A24 family peptidase C-terminal domain-containing protein [Candidatus Thermoplasmatota archaeon]